MVRKSRRRKKLSSVWEPFATLSHTPLQSPSPKPAGNWQEDRSKAPPLKGPMPDYGFVSTAAAAGGVVRSVARGA
jgi:hypothetical protein